MIEPATLQVVVAGLLGLICGSFLNVVIYRLPRHIPLSRGRSGCPHCGALITWWQNIPVASYLFLGGRCHTCKGPISIRYPIVELVTAVTFAAWTAGMGIGIQAAGMIYLCCVLICVVFIDWEFQIIPDWLTLPSLAVGWVWAAFAPLGLVPSLLGTLAGGGGLFLVALLGDWIFRKESMGGGDIKLAAVLGAFLGWKLVVLVFFVSALVGSLASGVWLLISRDMRGKRLIPFGPFLSVAAVVAALWGQQLIGWYLHNFWSIPS
jgi:leader peptidase (prepilin peptidase) / N-methyltransferase